MFMPADEMPHFAHATVSTLNRHMETLRRADTVSAPLHTRGGPRDSGAGGSGGHSEKTEAPQMIDDFSTSVTIRARSIFR